MALRQDQPHFHHHYGCRYRPAKRRAAPYDRECHIQRSRDGSAKERRCRVRGSLQAAFLRIQFIPPRHQAGRPRARQGIARRRQEVGGQRLKQLKAACKGGLFLVNQR